MNILYLGLAAFGGAILSALMGWADSKEPFDTRKFLKSIMAGILTGAGVAMSFTVSENPLGIRDYIFAFIAGSGIDVLSNRAMGALKK